jgi:adenylate cyclase
MGALSFVYNPALESVDMATMVQPATLVLVVTFVTVVICFLMIMAVTISLAREKKSLFARLNLEYDRVQIEKDKSDNLLLNILPESIANRIKKGDQVCDEFKETTILFSDICGFTAMSDHMPPSEIVNMLNEIFTEFDEYLVKYGVEKIKTIGDAYMVVCGLWDEEDHAERCIEFGLHMINTVNLYNYRHDTNIKIRVGLNTGRVVAGVIGSKKFTYDVWGDSVNVASRMESSGVPMNIQASASTYNKLKGYYKFKQRDSISIKGKGMMETYLLDQDYSFQVTPLEEKEGALFEIRRMQL